MKNVLCLLLACAMMLVSMLALVSCDPASVLVGTESDAESSTEVSTKEEVVIPEDYQTYSNSDLSFAYPKDWTKQDGSVVVLSGSNGNNVTVVYENKTDMYEKMTVDSFNAELKPALQAAGMEVSDVSIEKKTTNSLSVVVLSFKATMNGVSMKQTGYIITLGDKTYTVTVTEVQPDAELVATVLDTLQAAS